MAFGIDDIIGAAAGIAGLFGGGKSSSNSSADQAVALQKEATMPQLELFKSVGIPAYMTALSGIMSSYGYRPKASAAPGGTTAAGSTVGSTPVMWSSVADRINGTRMGRQNAIFNADSGEQVAGLVNDQKWWGDHGADFTAKVMADEVLKAWASQTPAVAAKLGLESAPGVSDYFTGGTWGDSAALNSQLAATSDLFDRAEQRLMAVAQSQNLPPATVAAALARLRTQRAEQQQQVELKARSEGPIALLNALGAALSSGSGAAQGASTLMDAAKLNAATGQYNDAATAANVAGVADFIGKLFAKKQPAPTLGSTGSGYSAPGGGSGFNFTGLVPGIGIGSQKVGF